MSITAVVDPVTNTFCVDGMQPGRVIVTVAVNPNPRLHRYSGDQANPIRDATAPETAAYDAAQTDAGATAVYDAGKLVQAVAVSYEAYRLGKTPGTLTAAELNAARSRVIAIYKSLP